MPPYCQYAVKQECWTRLTRLFLREETGSGRGEREQGCSLHHLHWVNSQMFHDTWKQQGILRKWGLKDKRSRGATQMAGWKENACLWVWYCPVIFCCSLCSWNLSRLKWFFLCFLTMLFCILCVFIVTCFDQSVKFREHYGVEPPALRLTLGWPSVQCFHQVLVIFR